MATITNALLTIQNLNATTVRVRVTYRLTPNNVEKLAGTVFNEGIRVIGSDPGPNEPTLLIFPNAQFAVNNNTPFVDRVRIINNVSKFALNEDPGFESTGAEQPDEVFARITVTYAANAPVQPALPQPLLSNEITGAWK